MEATQLTDLANSFVQEILRNKSEQEINKSQVREIILKSEEHTLNYALEMINIKLRVRFELPEVKVPKSPVRSN